LKLAGTGQDISAEQAEELIILWQTYKQLSESDTAAQAEVDGLVVQIRESMTTAQRQAITDLQITQQDVFTAMQGVSVTTNSSSESTVSVPSGSASGGAPAGGPPSDGGGAPPDGGMGMDMGGGAPHQALIKMCKLVQARKISHRSLLCGQSPIFAGKIA
jgi:hypothetical protein